MDSKVVRADFGSGLIRHRAQTCMDSNVVRTDFGSGLIRHRAQTCMDSNMVRADFGRGLIRPRAQTCCALKSSAPSGARQDNYADSGSACKLAGVQIIPLPTLANQIFARTFFSSVAVQLAYPAVEKFCRASSAGGRRRLQ